MTDGHNDRTGRFAYVWPESKGLLPVVKRPFFVFQDLGPGLCLDDFVFNWWEELTTGLPTGIVR
jgi:hypothetical protein